MSISITPGTSCKLDFQGIFWTDLLPQEKDWAKGQLEKLIDHTKFDTLDGVIERLKKHQFQLWFIKQEALTLALVLTKVVQHDKCKILEIYGISGEGLKTWVTPLAEVLDILAERFECERIVFHGRRGWERELKNKGWESVTVRMERRTNYGQ